MVYKGTRLKSRIYGRKKDNNRKKTVGHHGWFQFIASRHYYSPKPKRHWHPQHAVVFLKYEGRKDKPTQGQMPKPDILLTAKWSPGEHTRWWVGNGVYVSKSRGYL